MYDSINDAARQLRRSIERAEIFVNANVVEPVWPDKVRGKSEPEFRHSDNPSFEKRRQDIKQDIESSARRFTAAAIGMGLESDEMEQWSLLVEKEVDDLLNWETLLRVKLSRAEFKKATTAGNWTRSRADTLLKTLAPKLELLHNLSQLREVDRIPSRRLLSCIEEIQDFVRQTFLEPTISAEQNVMLASKQSPRNKRGKSGLIWTGDTLRIPISDRPKQEVSTANQEMDARIGWQSEIYPIVEFPGLFAYSEQHAELTREFTERLAEFRRAAKLAGIQGKDIIEISTITQESVLKLLSWDTSFRRHYEAKFQLGIATVHKAAAEQHVAKLMEPVNRARQRIYELQDVIDEPASPKTVETVIRTPEEVPEEWTDWVLTKVARGWFSKADVVTSTTGWTTFANRLRKEGLVKNHSTRGSRMIKIHESVFTRHGMKSPDIPS